MTYQPIPSDIWYNVLYHANVNDLHQLCQINQDANRLCQQNLWQDKFIKDQLPSYNKMYTIPEYLNMVAIKKEATQLIEVLKYGTLRSIRSIRVIYPSGNVINYYITFHEKYVDIALYKNMTYDEFQSWLMVLLYNDVDIQDYFNNIPFRKKHLTTTKGDIAKVRLNLYKKLNNPAQK